MADIVERLYARDWIPIHESEHASAMQPMCDEAADAIESLRQRVKELEKYQREAMCLRNVVSLLDDELAALKAGQGEPVAYLHKDRYSVLRPEALTNATNPADWEPVYTSSPTIPEGYVMVPVEPLHKLLEYAEESNSARYGTLSTRLVRDLVEEALAAAPKPEEI